MGRPTKLSNIIPAPLALKVLRRLPLPATLSAIFIASCSKLLTGTTASTKPSFEAFLPSTALPAKMISKEACKPITLGKRTQPPKPGMIPSLVSGKPIFVLESSEAKR